jgi:transcriptional regulator with XRE-family HTH domain
VKFTKEELARFQDLDEIENEVFSTEEREDIHRRAAQRAEIRRSMSETISKSVAAYMAQEKIGFNELTRRLRMSSATTSKILRGDANLTLDTLAAVAVVLGLRPTISFLDDTSIKNSDG